MLQFPAFMRQFPSPPLIPSSTLLPLWPHAQNDEMLLAMEESELEDKLNEIRKTNNNLVVIGKTSVDYKEDFDADAEDEDADNVEESDGDDFEQETG
ncbi:tRNA (guanine-N1-)-methyltransferase N-terminal protein [Dioscorea alata]|uniref:tRNA (Guanine-N1-)-methyltransferase N-terminal protein n=1 Tax=Dioscorea alata TaxID=55571 RepID=A0ACB7VAG0_DIOAL|nr:tRNA (guanine-N1-)-methyltransferase N-terminal protein [Dioscorea alata]